MFKNNISMVRKVSVTLLILIAVLALLLYLLGITFNKIFLSDILIGLLSNVIIFFPAIFVIDRIFKEEDYRKLQEVNQTRSKFITWAINRFCYKILEYLEIVSNDQYQKEKDPDLTLEWVADKFIEINKQGEWNKILYIKILEKENKKEYLLNLEELIKGEAGNLTKSLKEVYPHPASDITETVGEIHAFSGAIKAMSMISGVDEEVNKNIKEEKNKMDKEVINIFLKIVIMGNDHNNFNKFCDDLIKISLRSKSNTLFLV